MVRRDIPAADENSVDARRDNHLLCCVGICLMEGGLIAHSCTGVQRHETVIGSL